MRYCERFAALLDPYVDGELSGEEAARVRDHLETCPGCRRYVDGALAIRAAFPQVEETEVPEGFARGVMEAVREAEERKSGAGRRVLYWRKVLLPLAACFALVLILRAVPGRGGGAPAGDAAAPAAAMDTAASYGLPEEAPAPAEAEGVPEETESTGLQAAPETEDAANAFVEASNAPAEKTAGEGPALRIAAEPPAAGADDDGSAADTGGAQAVPTSGEEAPAALGIAPAAGGEETDPAPAEPWTTAARAPRALRLTAEEAGDLLADLPYTEEDGVRCYQLTWEDCDALLAALAERGIAPAAEEAAVTEVLPEGYDLVYVTEA